MFEFITRIFSKKKDIRLSVVPTEERKPTLTKEDLLNIYSTCPPLFRCINIRATICSKFLQLSGNGVEEILQKIPGGLAIIKSIIFRCSIDTDVFGAAFVETHLDDDLNPCISHIPASTVDFLSDHEGIILVNHKPKAIIQKVGIKEIEIPYSRISQLVYNPLTNDFTGLSLAELTWAHCEGYNRALEGFSAALKRLGFPIYDFSVGDNKHEPTPEIINHLANIVRNFHEKKEFIHEYFIKPSVTESKYMSQSADFDRPFIRAIAIASGIPEFMITGETQYLSLASARVMSEVLPFILLPSLHAPIERFVSDIFSKIATALDKDVKVNVSFAPIFTTDLLTTAQRAKTLSQIPNLCSLEELRKIAGLV